MDDFLFTTTVRLGSPELEWCARQRLKILQSHGKAIDRSSIVRAAIGGLADADLSVSDCTSAEEIRSAVSRRVGVPKAGKRVHV
jgi:hypothetical protein